MSVPLHKLAQEALALDAGERLQLAAELIESVEGAPTPAWAEIWTAELHRRSEVADGRAVRGDEWSEVRARLLRDVAKK